MAKSVIDIEVKAEAFDRFNALFKKYNDQLSKMPGQWNNVGKSIGAASKIAGEAGDNFDRISDSLEKIVSKLDDTSKPLNKLADQSRKASNNFKSIGAELINVGRSVTATTLQLAKWTTLGLIGAGGAGLFGLSSLAGGVSDTRRQAQGLGVSAGELRSANLNFSRYIDAASAMGNLAQAQTDPSKRWAFTAAGVNPNQSAAAALPELMRKAAEIYKAGPESTAASRLQARGFTELGISVSDARRLASLKEEELDTAIKKYAIDKKNLEVSDGLQRQWQDLDVQLERSKQNIVQAFITGLSPLVKDGTIEKFSESIADAVKTFLANPELKVWLQDFADGVRYVAENLPALMDEIAKWIPGSKSNQALQERTKTSIWGEGIVGGVHSADLWSKTGFRTLDDRRKQVMGYFTSLGLSPERAAGISGNFEYESGGLNPFASNKEGMYGLAQWSKTRQKDYAKRYGHPMQSVKDYDQALREQLEFAAMEMGTTERGAGHSLARAMTVEQSTGAFYSGFERPGAGDTSLGARTTAANAAYATYISSLRQNNVNLKIQNNTGGSATAVVGAAATPDLGFSN